MAWQLLATDNDWHVDLSPDRDLGTRALGQISQGFTDQGKARRALDIWGAASAFGQLRAQKPFRFASIRGPVQTLDESR